MAIFSIDDLVSLEKEGGIAFENQTMGCQRVYPGMKQSELYFGYLSGPIKDLKKSRYHRQTEACIKGDQ